MREFYIKKAGSESVWHIPIKYDLGVWMTACNRAFTHKGTNVVREVKPDEVCDKCREAIAKD